MIAEQTTLNVISYRLENPEIIADLKKLFGQEARRPVDKEKSGDILNTHLTSSFVGSRRVQEPQVLEVKTCQNISILLMSLKHPHELIKKMILSMDESLGVQVRIAEFFTSLHFQNRDVLYLLVVGTTREISTQ